MDKKVGHYAFIVGVILAIITGLFPFAVAQLALVLVALGVIVGFLNVTHRETTEFLIAAIAIAVAGGAVGLTDTLSMITWMNIGVYLSSILSNVLLFVAPAALVVGLKTIFMLAED